MNLVSSTQAKDRNLKEAVVTYFKMHYPSICVHGPKQNHEHLLLKYPFSEPKFESETLR
jgi:hypothetical protein